MQTVSLYPHSNGGLDGLDTIEVRVERPKRDRLSLDFMLVGEAVRHIELPRRIGEQPGRHDDLWRHTCFELFLRLGEGNSYYEYNLAPSRDWACYRFDSYREGMSPPRVPAPAISEWSHFPRPADRTRGMEIGSDGISRDFARPFFEVSATIDLSSIAVQQPADPWHIGLSAVIEDRKGEKSYWALKHPSGVPDFHDPDCFALQLPAARPA